MIKENELRSGNLILGFFEYEEDDRIYKCICEFLGYTPFSNYFHVKGEIYIEEFTKFDSIPLTEEWLLKFGFKKIEGTLYFNIGSIEIGTTAYGKRFYIQIGSENVTLNIKYVHQLQNLYFCLTGAELSVA